MMTKVISSEPARAELRRMEEERGRIMGRMQKTLMMAASELPPMQILHGGMAEAPPRGAAAAPKPYA